MKTENEIDQNDLRIWEIASEAKDEFIEAYNHFWFTAKHQLEFLQAGLSGGTSRRTALRVIEKRETDDKKTLFPQLLQLASYSHGCTAWSKQIILSLSRDWLLTKIESTAEPIIERGTYDNYLRLLELYIELDLHITYKLALKAFKHESQEIRELGLDYLNMVDARGCALKRPMRVR